MMQGIKYSDPYDNQSEARPQDSLQSPNSHLRPETLEYLRLKISETLVLMVNLNRSRILFSRATEIWLDIGQTTQARMLLQSFKIFEISRVEAVQLLYIKDTHVSGHLVLVAWMPTRQREMPNQVKLPE